MDKFQQLVNKYKLSFPTKKQELQTALCEKDFDQLHHLLHKLTGSSGSYGFIELSHNCNQATYILDNITHDNFDELNSKIEQIYQHLTKV